MQGFLDVPDFWGFLSFQTMSRGLVELSLVGPPPDENSFSACCHGVAVTLGASKSVQVPARPSER